MKRSLQMILGCAVLVSVPLWSGCHRHPIGLEECSDVVLTAGVDDNFAPGNDEHSSQSDELIAFMNYHYRSTVPSNLLTDRFDETNNNRGFGHTFRIPFSGTIRQITGAKLTLRLRAISGDAGNDVLHITDVTGNTPDLTNIEGVRRDIWSTYLRQFNGGRWKSRDEITIVFDLANMPTPEPDVRESNLLEALMDGTLCIYVQDDTAVDFARLEVSYCTEEIDDDPLL